jgi:general secretion pathway protein D
MKTRRLAATFLAVAALQSITAGVAHAQFDFEAPPTPPWELFKLDPKTRVNLDFRNASVDAVLRVLSTASGIAIVKDPALTGGITLQSPKPQTLKDAFAMLDTVLGLRNFEIRKDGNFLVIRSRQQRGGRGFNNTGMNFDPSMFGGGRGNDTQLKVYTIKFANASQVARVINEVFINSGQQQPFPQGFPGTIPAAAPQPTAPTPPNRGPSPAPEASPDPQRGDRGGRGGGFGGFGGGGGGGRGNFQFGGFGGRGGNNSVVRASADDYSNSVIVNAPRNEQEQVGKLIESLDKKSDEPQQSKVFPLKYATATDLAPVVQNVLVSNAPRGRGGIGSQNVPIDQRFQQAARFGSAQAAFGQVVADTRTNSLVVTGTPDNLTVIEELIKQLDTEVKFESSSFVITLENARADQIADLMNQSFGGRTTTGGRARTGTGLTGGQNRNNQNRNNQNNPGGGGGGGRGGPNSENQPIELEDPDAEAGPLATTVSVQQGGGFGQFNRQQNRQQSGTTTGLDSQGRVINVRDLTGQVVAIPDINTNSVIVVTSPENRALLEQILQQLDKIPEQVMIETLIVEASLDATKKLGVEWSFGTKFNDKTSGAASSSFGMQANAAQPQGFRYTLTGPQYSAFLQAVQTDARFSVLSTPRIFTSNNATAEINISQSLPYVLSSRTDVNGNVLFTYAFLDVGIILTVTPRITSNGYVTMDVTQTANDFVRYTDFNAPVVNQREAQTTVSVKDGETVVLGGIIKNSVSSTVNKIPLLGDIPLLGNLFKSTSTSTNKTELLVFLTPRVVRDENEARRLRENTEKQMPQSVQDRINASRNYGKDPAAPTPAPLPTPVAPPPGEGTPKTPPTTPPKQDS